MDKPTAQPTELLDMAQVAAWLGLSKPTVSRLCRDGKLRYKRVSERRIRFKPDWVEAYLNAPEPDPGVK